jgi:hypothetical protein
VIVWTWPGGGHHVTFYDHRVEDSNFWCCGGNQEGHTVTVKNSPMSASHVIRRPPPA